MRFGGIIYVSSRGIAAFLAVVALLVGVVTSATLYAEGYPPGQVGEACYVHADCATGLICTQRVPAANDLPSSCQPHQASGEECLTDADCADEFFCDDSIAPIRTVAVPFPVGKDASCQPIPSRTYEERCSNDSECTEGLLCNISFDAGEHRCLPLLSEGGPCRRDVECQPDLVCNWALPASAFIPQSCRPPLGIGAPCAGRHIRIGFSRRGSSECQVGLTCVLGYVADNGYPNSCQPK